MLRTKIWYHIFGSDFESFLSTHGYFHDECIIFYINDQTNNYVVHKMHSQLPSGRFHNYIKIDIFGNTCFWSPSVQNENRYPFCHQLKNVFSKIIITGRFHININIMIRLHVTYPWMLALKNALWLEINDIEQSNVFFISIWKFSIQLFLSINIFLNLKC